MLNKLLVGSYICTNYIEIVYSRAAPLDVYWTLEKLKPVVVANTTGASLMKETLTLTLNDSAIP